MPTPPNPTELTPRQIVEQQFAALNLGDAHKAVAWQIALAESGGTADAKDPKKNPNSTASGIFQITKDTFLDMEKSIRKHSPEVADKMLEKGKNDPYSQAHAYVELARKNEENLKANNLPVNATNLYVMHFIGRNGGPKVLKAADDAPLAPLVDAGTLSANASMGLDKMTVGQFKADMARRMGAHDATAEFVLENDFINPGKSLEFAVQGMRDLGKGTEAEGFAKQIASDKKDEKLQGLTGLKQLAADALLEKGVKGADGKPPRDSLHLAMKFGAPAAIALAQNQDETKKLSELGIKPEALAAYQAESKALLKEDVLKALPEDKRKELTEALGKGADTATEKDLQAIVKARGDTFVKQNEAVQEQNKEAGGEGVEKKNDMLKELLGGMLGGDGMGMMIIMLIVMMAAMPQGGEKALDQAQGQGTPGGNTVTITGSKGPEGTVTLTGSQPGGADKPLTAETLRSPMGEQAGQYDALLKGNNVGFLSNTIALSGDMPSGTPVTATQGNAPGGQALPKSTLARPGGTAGIY